MLAKAELAAWLGDTSLALSASKQAFNAPGSQLLAGDHLATANRLAWPLAFANEVRQAAKRHGVAPSLVFATIRQESGFDPAARSSSNAFGLMQLLPATADRIGLRLAALDGQRVGTSAIAHCTDAPSAAPVRNVNCGTWYLACLLEQFSNQLPLAVAAYNAGPVAVGKWLKQQPARDLALFVELLPKAETRRYTKQVLANWAAYSEALGEPAMRLPVRLQVAQRFVIDF